jgi:drug/metabolite transporter (DMT)-like permease
MKAEATIQKTEMVNRVMGIKEWSLIAILSILWGGSFFFVGVAVKEMPPLTIVLCRVALASIILLVIVYLKGDKMPSSPGLWGAFIIMGALNNLIPFSLIVWGQTHISTSLAYIIYFQVLATAGPTNLLLVTFLIPVSAILLGVVVLAERLAWNAFAGMGLIFIGLIAIDGRLLKMFKRKEDV